MTRDSIPYEQARETISGIYAGIRPRQASLPGAFAKLLFPAINAFFVAHASGQAYVRTLRVLNAIQAHVPAGSNEVPKLSELGLPAEATTDPFNGEPLHVKRLPQGWLVYSVGRNLRDDDGKLDDNSDVGVGPPIPAAKPVEK